MLDTLLNGNQYRSVVDSSDDAIITKDLNGVISSWNSGAQRMFGYTEAEAIGQSITIIIPPELHHEEMEILRRRESEESFRLVANPAPVMIWMSDVDKRCTYFNHGWLEFIGRPFEAELGNGWSEGVHPADLEACLESYTRAFDRREPFSMEYRLRRQDGKYRWIFDEGVPRFKLDGSFAGYIGSAFDVTRRKLAEAALSTRGAALHQIDAAPRHNDSSSCAPRYRTRFRLDGMLREGTTLSKLSSSKWKLTHYRSFEESRTQLHDSACRLLQSKRTHPRNHA